MKHNYSKAVSIVIIAAIYAIAAGIGLFVFALSLVSMPETYALLAADVVATLIVWGWGLVYENVSVYDPYWSVAPPIIFTAWAALKGILNLPVAMLLTAVWLWGIRLTWNWAYTFKGLGHEDWRYTKYRMVQKPLLFQLTNLFGLNMMPTLLVFACMLPGLGLFGTSAPTTAVTWLGFAICLAAVTIELAADTTSHRFRDEHPGEICEEGLWRNGRHPNYCGEMSFWWGVWVMYASLEGIDWLILAPIAMSALFLFISIPMMEKRQLANKPGYAEYRERTRLLI